MQPSERLPSVMRGGLIIVATLATAYMASHFFRASNVTIGLDLMRDLSIGPEALGALTGAFFFGFAAMQIPCGFFFDRFGPRRTVAAMLVLATIGGIIFTTAPSWPVLLTGRVLLGAGFGVMLIGSMVVITRWFPPDRFSTLTAVVLSVGLLGNLIATTPLAWASEISGWRTVFAAAVLFTAIAAIAVWIVVRDAPPGHPFHERKQEAPGEMLQGLLEVLRNPRLRPILALNFFNYACTFTVQGLWGGPYCERCMASARSRPAMCCSPPSSPISSACSPSARSIASLIRASGSPLPEVSRSSACLLRSPAPPRRLCGCRSAPLSQWASSAPPPPW